MRQVNMHKARAHNTPVATAPSVIVRFSGGGGAGVGGAPDGPTWPWAPPLSHHRRVNTSASFTPDSLDAAFLPFYDSPPRLPVIPRAAHF